MALVDIDAAVDRFAVHGKNTWENAGGVDRSGADRCAVGGGNMKGVSTLPYIFIVRYGQNLVLFISNLDIINRVDCFCEKYLTLI